MIRFRLQKRKSLPAWAKIVIPIAAILVTLMLSAIPILMAGGQLAGFVGVVMALPVAAVIMVFLRHAVEFYRASDMYTGEE